MKKNYNVVTFEDKLEVVKTYWKNKFDFSPAGWVVMISKWTFEAYFLIHVIKHI